MQLLANADTFTEVDPVGFHQDGFRVRDTKTGDFLCYECAFCEWLSPNKSKQGNFIPANLQSLFMTGHIRREHESESDAPVAALFGAGLFG